MVCRQRWARAGSIPMAVMASALRIAASAAFSARTDASLASISLRRVARSLTTAKPNSSTAPAMPMVPSTGWIMKTTARNTGDQGASNSGMMPAPPTYPRSVDRSRSPCADTPPPARRASATAPASTGLPSSRSSHAPVRARSRRRTASSRPKVASATTTIALSASSVSTLPVVSTRS